jgi:hypothetical protein
MGRDRRESTRAVTHYEAAPVPLAEAVALLRAAERAVATAERIVNGTA